jgi:hypothetical protein
MLEATITGNDTGFAGRNRYEGICHMQHPIQWWLIVKRKNKYTLHLLNLPDSHTGMRVMQILHKYIKSTKQTCRWYHSRPQIEEATLSPVRIPIILPSQIAEGHASSVSATSRRKITHAKSSSTAAYHVPISLKRSTTPTCCAATNSCASMHNSTF